MEDAMERGKAAGLEAVRETLQGAVPLNRHLGLEVLEVGAGNARVRLPEKEELKNHVGTQHAAALFAAGEAASGAAVVGLLASRFGPELGGASPLATGAEIRYLKPAAGTIIASGELEGEAPELLERIAGGARAEFSVEVVLSDGAGDGVVARMMVRWHARMRGAR
jgi:acyl-coenzyme A thioesterase PaaI-like protein